MSFFFFQAEDGIRDHCVTGVQTCALPIYQRALGADFLALSAAKWCGPHVGAVVAHPALLEELQPDKLLPATDRVPDRFEAGAPAFELLAGVSVAVDHLAGLCPDA